MRRWDKRAIQVAGISERTLIETAARAAASVVHQLHPTGRIVAAVGAGNNGADALVLLRVLRAWGREVIAVLADGVQAKPELLHGWDVELVGTGEAERIFRDSAVIVDGLLGTGGTGAPRPPQAALIETIGRAGRPVIALDGPSGVDLTSGAISGPAIRADLTVTFGAPKRGLLLFPGRAHAGRIIAFEVGFPPLAPDEHSAALITPDWARRHLPRISPNAYKGELGTVAIVAGHPGMAGAALLAGLGAGRAGAGKIELVSVPENREILQVAIPEALFVERESEGLEGLLERAGSVVAGPGMGTDDEDLAVLRWVVATGDAPLLLDADALTLLARTPDLLKESSRPVLLTPHPGEMSRLLGVDTRAITADPFRFAGEAAERWGCPVLLKGSPALVAAPGKATLINVAGHSGIATGGMGDVLAGVAGALLAQGASPRAALALALFYAGRAAEIAGRERSLLPRDVTEALPAALADPGTAASPMALPGVILDLPPAR